MTGANPGTMALMPMNGFGARTDFDSPTNSFPFFTDQRWSPTHGSQLGFGDPDTIEKAAKLHRSAASELPDLLFARMEVSLRTEMSRFRREACKNFYLSVLQD